MSAPLGRPGAREATTDLLVAQHWERFTGWLLDHTRKWPKSARFTLAQRVENLALDVVEGLVVSRYEPRERERSLRQVNLCMERMRFLCRVARDAQVMPTRGFEAAMRGLDEAGRMIHGWRMTIDARRDAGGPAVEQVS